jgi:hypothetical protein
MAREIGYFYYESRTSIEMYGSGDFYSTTDEGYIYGWSETLTTFTLRAYLKTFEPDTTGSKAGIQLRQQAKDNVPFVGIMVDGDGFIKIYRRATTDGIVYTSFPTDVNVTQGIWFEMYINGNTIAFKYSLQPEETTPASITWITLDTSVDDTASYGTIEKHLCCSSGSDNVNLAYFTKVYTEDCWISPIGQKE